MPVDGECTTQEVFIIPNNPVPSTGVINVPDNPFPGCCNDFVLKVLADDSGKATQNDIGGPDLLKWAESIVTSGTMALKQWNGTTWATVDNLTTTSVGTPYVFGFYTNNEGQNFIGYQIEWAKVLSTYGTGSYKVTFSFTIPVLGNITVDTNEYCLQTYTPQLAEGTMRLEYWLNGIMGDNSDDTKIRDYGNLNWYHSLRVRGFFGYPKSEYKEDDTQLNSGQFLYVEDEKTPIYIMKLLLLPAFIHDIISTDYMMADRLAVTDYNSMNPATYIQKFLRKNSGYEPTWHKLQNNLASVELTFRNEFNRFRKLRY